MWMHVNTSPQFSNKTSEDKLKFSILLTYCLVCFAETQHIPHNDYQRGKGGRGWGEEAGAKSFHLE